MYKNSQEIGIGMQFASHQSEKEQPGDFAPQEPSGGMALRKQELEQ